MQHPPVGLRTFRGPATKLIPALVLALIAAAALSGCGGSATPTAPSTTAVPITTTAGSAGSTSSSGPSTSVTGANPSPTSSAAAAEAKVVMKGSAFDPVTVTIKAGGIVTWENQDGAQHDVAADDGTFKSTPFGKGASFSFRFAKPGTYTYSCTLQPSMKGEVMVQ